MALDGGTVVIDVYSKYHNGLSPGIDTADKKVDKFTESISDAESALGRLSGKKSKLDVDDKATGKVNKFMQTTKQFAGKTFKSTVRIVDYATKPLRAIKDSLFSIKGLVAAVGSGMAFNSAVLNPISIADKDTSSEIFFNTLMGEGKGADFVKQIEGIAKSSSMDYDASMSAVQSMLGMGWDQTTVLSDLQTLIDTTAALGGGADKLGGIALALSQIKSKGKLSTEELNQLAERGVNAKGFLAEQLGYGSGDAALAKLSKDLESGNIGSDKAIEALLTGMKEAYAGIDAETARSTASGILSQITDTFKIDVVKRWGKGLQDGAVKSLGSVLDLLEENEDLVVKLGDAFYELGSNISNKVASGVEKLSNNLMKVLDSEEFANADLGGKIGILWDEVIAKPFSEWWDSKGNKLFAEKAASIGTGIGEGLTAGLLGLLGIDVAGAANDGVSIGGAFAKGIAEGFDGSAVAEAVVEALKKGLKDALKILPGGESATETSWLSAAIFGGLGLKMGGGKLLGKLGGKLAGSFKGGSLSDNKAYAKFLETSANPTGKSSLFGKLSKFNFSTIADDVITSGGKFGSFLGKASSGLSKAGKGLGKFAKGNWLSLLFSGAAIFSAEDKAKETAKQGVGLAGSAAGGAAGTKIGAAIGSFIMPGAGTAVGGAVGGLVGSTAGYIAGEKGGGKLWDSVKGWDGWDSMKEGWNGFIDGAKNFFTKTIPEKWNKFIDGGKKFFTETIPEKWNDFIEPAKAFFTETIPEKWDEFIGNAKTFFTETIPEKWDEFVDNAVTFFTETLPYKVGELVGEAEVFFTETLPEWWNNSIDAVGTFFTETLPEWWNIAVEAVGTFFTETLPEWWSEKVDAVGTFFTETLPEWWGEKMDAIGTFFTETLPEWWGEKMDAIGTFFTETLPEWWGEKMDAIGTFFTETLPGWWETTVNDFITYWTVDVPAYWNGKVDEIAEGWQEIKDKWSGAVDTITGWFSDKADTVKEKYETAKGWIDEKWTSIKENFGEGREDAKHATGGIFSRPHVGLVAEDGPEAIIPLGAKRRQRGLDLWKKAGAAMGVTAYAEGGIIGSVPTGGGSNSIQIDVGGVHIHVDGGNATLLEALNSQSEEIKEAIAGILYDVFSKNFNNMPITI